MDRTIRYVSGSGEVVSLDGGVWDYVDTDLHDFEVGYDTLNGRIYRFNREPRTYALTVVLKGGTRAQGLALRNRLYEVAAQDRAAMTPGTVYVCGSQMRCYVTAASKSLWHYHDGRMTAKVTLATDDPVWRRMTGWSIAANTAGSIEQPLDLGSADGTTYAGPDLGPEDLTTATLTGSESFATIAVIRFYGPCTNPSITIAGNVYGVNAVAKDGERIEIDGVTRAVRKVGIYGTATNLFSSRVRGAAGSGSYVFEAVPAGSVQVVVPVGVAVDVELWEERDEPAWA